MTTTIAPTVFAPSHPPSTDSSRLLNLLIVDDDRLVREACREAAATLGYHTSTSQSAEQALCFIESQAIDIVLLDLKLRESERLDILREIKRRRPDIEVVVASADASVDSAVQVMKNGASDYVAKPFGMQELKLLLERAEVRLKQKMEGRRLRERNSRTIGRKRKKTEPKSCTTGNGSRTNSHSSLSMERPRFSCMKRKTARKGRRFQRRHVIRLCDCHWGQPVRLLSGRG